jgi:hypothetical protein
MEKKTKIKCNGSVLKTVTCARGLAVVGLPGATPAWQGLARTGHPGLRSSRDTSAGPNQGQPKPAQTGKREPAQPGVRRTCPAGTLPAPAQAGLTPHRPSRDLPRAGPGGRRPALAQVDRC